LSGAGGAFKDDILLQWLKEKNPQDVDLKKAVESVLAHHLFFLSFLLLIIITVMTSFPPFPSNHELREKLTFIEK